MPVVEPAPLPHNGPTFLDDAPAPRRPSPEPLRTIEPLKTRPQEKPVHSENKTPPPKELRPKHKPPPESEQPAESEYDDIDDDSKIPLVEKEILRQLLDLDEDDDREFSREMVWDYFQQAEGKFDEMDFDFSSKNLENLSLSGHFLKGSSAALGLSRVQSTCEKIQHCGAKRDEKLDKGLTEEEALDVMGRLLKKVRSQYKEAKEWLEDFFENNRSLEDD